MGAKLSSLEVQYGEIFEQSPLFSPHVRYAFEVLETLGEGGMGTVYRVWDKRIGREAAMKRVKADQDSDALSVRFLREAKTTAILDHPAIPSIYEIGRTSDGQLYMLMPVIRGQTLQQAIHSEMSQRQLLELFVKVCDALAYVHAKGFIHRDLKPENIMIGQYGEVFIMDWGLVKNLNDQHPDLVETVQSPLAPMEQADEKLTQAGHFLGTPGYASPEQIDGATLDESSDIFSMGCVLTELLTSEVAVSGDQIMAKISKTLKDGAHRPRAIDPQIDAELDWIADQALQFLPEQRTGSASEMAAQLRAYLAREDVPGYPYSLWQRSQRRLARHQGLVMALSLLAMLVLTGLGVALDLDRRRQKLELELKLRDDMRRDVAEQLERMKRVQRSLRQARLLAERGASVAGVRSKIEDCLKLGGRSKEHLLECADIYIAGGFSAEARRLLNEAVRQHPPCYSGRFALYGLDSKEMGLIVESPQFVKIVEESIKDGVENEFTWFARAGTCFRNKDYQGALHAFNKVEDYTSRFAPLYAARGGVWALVKNYRKALDDYNQAIQLAPGFVMAYVNRATVWRLKKDYDRALLDLNKAATLEPENVQVLMARARTWKLKGNDAKALEDYAEVIRIDPKQAAAYAQRSAIYKTQEDYDKAISDCRSALKLNRKDWDSYYRYGLLLKIKKRYDLAIKSFTRCLQGQPQAYRAYVFRAVCHENLGDLKRALADYNKALEINPGYGKAFHNRGSVHLQNKNYQAAVKDYSKALKLIPDSSGTYLLRAQAYVQIKAFSRAVKDFSVVLSHAPKYVDAYYGRAICYLALKLDMQALKDFQTVLRLSPKHRQIDRVKAHIKALKQRFSKNKP